jgi:hypothetical protein
LRSFADRAGFRREPGASGVLTIGEQQFKSSRLGTVFAGDPRYHGKAEVTQSFDMHGPLLDALTAGGPSRLAYLDSKGATVAQADLAFASGTVIQGAVEKTFPTALALATKKSQC